MALVHACDVYGTTRKVHKYRFDVTELHDDVPGGQEVTVRTIIVHLSPRGFDRMTKLMLRGSTPPKAREKAVRAGLRSFA